MEISSLKALVESISLYFQLSSHDSLNSEPALKYYKQGEEILKLVKPILDAIFSFQVASHEVLSKAFEELRHSVEDLRDSLESWQPLLSKVYFVTHNELLLSQIRSSGLDIVQLLMSSDQLLPDELSSASIEHCAEKIRHVEHEQASSLIKETLRDQVEGVGPSSEILAKVAASLSLKSNQEILIEAVALEKLKENAEQAEKPDEVDYIDQLITLVTCMHERLIMIKQSQSSSPVPIPADFCCPLSLELMTDPVIVASGQTYERAFIRKWLDLGLTVCPKTRQTLGHTNLIPNYTVKALIANWCESNNVKLPDPLKSMSSNHPSPLLAHADCGALLGNHTMSPESVRVTGSPIRNSTGFGGTMPRGRSSPLHPRSPSDGSLPRLVGNGQGLDIGRLSRAASEESSTNLEDTTDLDGQPSLSPPRKDSSNADDHMLRSHKRAVSASSAHPNGNISQGDVRDANGSGPASNQLRGYSSDASGEVKPEAASNMSTPQREAELPPRLTETRSRSHPIWRRQSDRFGPRMIPSAAEARPDLSGIETQVKKLVEDLQSECLGTQREATSELRLLAKHNMDNRIVIANCGAINMLVGLLHSTDSVIQENAVTSLLNLSINDNNKVAIANAEAIEPLIHVLETGSPEAKENSAATLFSLSVIEDNKIRIGRSGAIGPLVNLLGNGTPRGKKDAATALFNLSIYHENKGKIVKEGAVKYLVDLMDPAAGMVDKAVAVLANLATIPEGRVAIGQEGGIPVLVEVVELGSARGKENAAAALLHLCTNSSRYCSMVLQEGAVPPLVALSQSGTPRAKEKAQALLSYFRNQRHGNAGRG
ncbi:U-box domain-containing protein 4-like [Punica granatum]|uniref:RING-type E3 ubiquitin transferase n=2 Tax=Punica granatum TaxID=22663 RepID=A0A6P8DEV0_PUNGR|nr:U-box domain-containing protein 4-like [Punica granatum]XP_031395776.1 U-box domain-containing protein 4-like [Punica granatum]XP_031395777.1 U-box domain-containing protein 4-like [Punica granatum]XP_031395778.1 U-box domain-containing protein 4-like [Punica granatum]